MPQENEPSIEELLQSNNQLLQDNKKMMEMIAQQGKKLEILEEMMQKSLFNDQQLGKGIDAVNKGFFNQKDFQANLAKLLENLVKQGSDVVRVVNSNSKKIRQHMNANDQAAHDFILQVIHKIQEQLASGLLLPKGGSIEIDGKPVAIGYTDEVKELIETDDSYVPTLEDIKISFTETPRDSRLFWNDRIINYRENVSNADAKFEPLTISLNEAVSHLFSGISRLETTIDESRGSTIEILAEKNKEQLAAMELRLEKAMIKHLQVVLDSSVESIRNATDKGHNMTTKEVAKMLGIRR